MLICLFANFSIFFFLDDEIFEWPTLLTLTLHCGVSIEKGSVHCGRKCSYCHRFSAPSKIYEFFFFIKTLVVGIIVI